jgi:hypothetical protein
VNVGFLQLQFAKEEEKNWGSLSTQQNILFNLRMQIAENWLFEKLQKHL